MEEVTRGAARDSEIDSVFPSSSGGLWLTTEGAGLLFWKDGRITTFADRRCTPARKQGQLVEDRDGALWVQATAGLFRLRGTVCEQIGIEHGYPGGFPAGILLDSDGTLWVKTRTGPLLFLPRRGSAFRLSEYGEGLSTGFAFLHEAPDGTIWLSDDHGLRRVASKLSVSGSGLPEKGEKSKAEFGDFTFAADGTTLWAATGKGVQRFDHIERWSAPVAVPAAPGEIFTPERGLSSDAVWKVVIDREGIVWVGTNSGLDQLRRAAFVTLRLPHAQEHEFGVAPGGDGSVWIGNSSLPLTRVAADGAATSIPGTRQTIGLRRDRNGTIWWSGGGDFRLWRSSAAASSALHYPDETLDPVMFASVDRDNDPWITTRSGRAWRLVRGAWSNETRTLGKKPGVLGAMVDDQAGNVWFAFSNKVVQWDGSAYHRSAFPDGARGVSENTMSVRADHVWLGGAGGVQLFMDGRFFLMRWKDKTLPGRVSGVVETSAGDLWVNGFSGISHVSAGDLKNWLRDPGSEVTAEHLDEQDGLPGLSGEVSPEPSVVEAPGGRLWFATTRGIAWLDPATLARKPNRLPPPVIISAATANGRSYGASNGLTLPPQIGNLEIDFTALSLGIPERVFFRYKLDRVDNDWQDVGTRRQAYYTKLRPGNYTFHVIARNNDGVWNESGATLEFNVAPAWFQTWWFLLLCAACGVLMVTALYRLRLRQVKAVIHARFDERLSERNRIARELHDTLLQGFLSASMHVHIAADSLPGDSDVKPILSRALELMGQVIEEGRNAVRGLRSPNSVSLNLEQAFAGVRREIDPEIVLGTQVQFRVIAEGDEKPIRPLLRDEVYRIGREALINAFRHARANHIDVTLKYFPNQLQLLVRDDGCGIDPDIVRAGREGHWGLSGMRERADRIGARLSVRTGPSAGTEIELTVPGKIAFQDGPEDKTPATRKARAVVSGGEK